MTTFFFCLLLLQFEPWFDAYTFDKVDERIRLKVVDVLGNPMGGKKDLTVDRC